VSTPELISVVVTCYNLEAYVEEAVRSALGQQDVGPFEVIVVDDCSTDGSAERIARIPGIKPIRLERNGGVMLATIAGTAAAQGDVVCFLDGDDIWEPGKLAAVRRAFEDSQLALLTHDLAFIDAGGSMLERSSRPSQEFGRVEPAQWPDCVREGILSLGDYVWLGSALCIRKGAARWSEFADWVRRMPDPANVYQDWPLAFWVASQAEARLGYIGEKLFRYRVHGANHSGDARTPELAGRNYRRSFLTLDEIRKLAETRSAGRKHLPTIAARAQLNEANMLAFQGKRLAAARLLSRALPRLLAHRLDRLAALKLAGVITIGPRLATRMRRNIAWPNAQSPAEPR
jgi:glycosyltransferase involved in cell wall biosynthesis